MVCPALAHPGGGVDVRVVVVLRAVYLAARQVDLFVPMGAGEASAGLRP